MAQQLIHDPYFNEYVFDCIRNSTIEQRQKLTGILLKACKNVDSAKKFADKASFEMKIVMLTRLGMKFGIFYSKPENFSVKGIKEIYDQHNGENKLSALNKTLERQTFVQTDKDIHLCLAMLSQMCHNETYMLNREYLFAGESIDGFESQELASSSEINSSVEAAKFVSKLLLHSTLGLETEATGANRVMMIILMYLFWHRSQNISIIKLQSSLKPYRKVTIQNALKKLNDLSYVQKSGHDKTWTISGMGITVLTNFIDRMIRASA